MGKRRITNKDTCTERIIILAVSLLMKRDKGEYSDILGEENQSVCTCKWISETPEKGYFDVDIQESNYIKKYLETYDQYYQSKGDTEENDDCYWLHKSKIEYLKVYERLENLSLLTMREAQWERIRSPGRTQGIIKFKLGPFPTPDVSDCLQHHAECREHRKNPLIPISSLELTNGFPAAPEGSFVGEVRANDLKKIHLHLTSNKKPLSITGMGGLGKSTLAREYLLTYAEHYPGGICWVPAKTGEYNPDKKTRDSENLSRINTIINNFGTILGITVDSKIDDAETRMKEFWRQLPDIPTLFIFDDMKSTGQLKRLLPNPEYDKKKITILCTSRMMTFGASADTYPLELPTLNDALSQLSAIVGAERVNKELETVKIILGTEAMDRLPLAVLLLGSYLSVKQHDPIVETLERIREIRQNWTPGSKTYIGDEVLEDIAHLTEAQKGLRAIFKLTWNWLPEAIQQIAKILPLFSSSFVDWEAVKVALNKGYKELGDEHLSPINQETAEGALILHSLITRTFEEEGTKAYTYHELIGEFIRSETTRTDDEQWLLSVENNAIENVITRGPYINYGSHQVIISAYQRRIQLIETGFARLDSFEGDTVAKLTTSLPKYYVRVKNKKAALSACEITLPYIRRRFLKTTPKVVGEILIGIAELYSIIDKENESISLCEEVIEIEKEGNSLSENIVDALSIIGTIKINQNELSIAESALTQALDIAWEMFGEESKQVTGVAANIGMLYIRCEKYEKAQNFIGRAIEIRSKLPNFSSYDIIPWYLNLGEADIRLGNYSDGKYFLEAALKLAREAYGEKHYYVSDALRFLAQSKLDEAQYDERKYQEAVSLYQSAEEINRELDEEESIKVVKNLKSLGTTYTKQSRHNEAEEVLIKVLEMTNRLVGKNHREYSDTLVCLADVYRVSKQYHKAESFIKQAIEIDKIIFGNRSSDISINLGVLSNIYCDQQKYTEAIEVIKDSLSIPNLKSSVRVTSFHNLAWIYEKQKNYKESEKYFKAALETTKEIYGNNHHKVAGALSFLGGLYFRQNLLDKAEPLLKKSLEINRESFGELHLVVVKGIENLGCLYNMKGELTKAENLLGIAVKLKRELLTEGHPEYQETFRYWKEIQDRIQSKK